MSAPLQHDAAFRYTDAGQAAYHYLGGRLHHPVANPVQEVHVFRPSDKTGASRHVAIGGVAQDLSGLVRFDGNQQSLVDFIAAGRRGASIDYFPSLAQPWLSFPCELIEASAIRSDPSFWFARRFECDVLLRRRDGGSWQALLEEPFFYWLGGVKPHGLSFTRNDAVGTAIDEDGVLQTFGVDEYRTDHLDLDGDGIRETPSVLLEAGRTNLITSDDFDAGWGGAATATTTDDPAGGSAAYAIEDDDGAVREQAILAVTFTGDGVKSALFVVRENTHPASGGAAVSIHDATAGAERLALTISAWTDGEPTVTATAGTLLEMVELSGGWWLIRAQTTAVTAANTNQAIITPALTTAETGILDVYRVNAYDAAIPSASVLDASVTRASEVFQVTEIPWTPQDIVAAGGATFYSRWVERGTAFLVGGGAHRYWQVGGSTDRIILHAHTSTEGRLQASFTSAGTAVDSDSTTGVVAIGDTVEARVVVFLDGSDWKIQLHWSINGGAEVSATATTIGSTLPSAWDETAIIVGNDFGGVRAGLANHIAHKFVRGVYTLDEVRAL